MKKLLFLLVSLLVIVACEKPLATDPEGTTPDPGGTDPEGTTYNVTGAIQKGPFSQGTSITIQELDDKFAPTGKSYQTQTTDDAGAFKLDSKITTRYVEIIAEGYYFNEVDGEISASQLTLRTISDLTVTGKTNINVLTSIANEKVKSLILKEKLSFKDALSQAETEVLNTFNMPKPAVDMQFDKLDITQTGEHNAMLLAISITLQSDRSVGEMSELISKISAEINEFGEIKNASIKEQVQTGAVGIDSDEVKNNLVTRYAELGVDCDVPDFQGYVDSDGNGVIDSHEDWLFVRGEKTYNINYTNQNIDIEVEQNINYEISISYAGEAVDPWITHEKITTKADIVQDSIRFTIAENSLTDERTATITFLNPEDENQKSEIVIVQSPEGAIVLGNKKDTVDATIQSFELTFDSNIPDFEVKISPASTKWIRPATPTRRTMQSYVRKFELDINTENNPRSVTLVITAGELEEEVILTQRGQLLFEASPEHLSVSNKEQKARFTVKHNQDYTIDWSNLQVNWSYSLVEEGDTEDIYEVSFIERGGWDYDLLLSTIAISQNDGSKTINYEIYQAPTPKVQTDETLRLLDNKEQIIEYKVETNVELVPMIDVDWITIVADVKPSIRNIPEIKPPPDANLTELTYKFNIKTNNENGTRTGNITFKSIYGEHVGRLGDPFVVSIEQRGEDLNLVIDNLALGDLTNRLSENEIKSVTSLTISGALSHSDIKNVISSMPNLFELNISRAQLENNTLPYYAFADAYGGELGLTQLTRLTLPDNNYTFEQDGLGALNLKYINFGGVEIIPAIGARGVLEELVFNSVKELASGAFTYQRKLTSISFPASIEKIEAGAFSSCDNIESITFADGSKITSLPSFGDEEGLKKLTSVNFGANSAITTLRSTFQGCSNLSTIILPSTLKYIDDEEVNGTFYGTAIESIEIPENVEIIKGPTFLNCKQLREVTFIGNSKLKTIEGGGLFYGCSALEEITIPASVEKISGMVFYGCANLKRVNFAPDSKLKVIEGRSIPDPWVQGSVGSATSHGWFVGCGLETITFPASITEIGFAVFKNGGIKHVIAQGVERVGSEAFAGSVIETFDFPNLTTIGDYAFERTAPTTISFPKVTTIGEGAFRNCANLTDISLPELTAIGEGAFSHCTSLPSISFPKIVTASGLWIFSGCTSLVTVDLPKLMDIGNVAFENCTSLTSISLPEIRVLRASLFEGCTKLATVDLPKVTMVEYGVFSGCSSMTAISLPEVVTFGRYSFSSSNFITEITENLFPKLTTIEEEAFKNSTITRISHPNITSIGNNAFANCSELTLIDLPNVDMVRSFANCTSIISISLPSAGHVEGFSGCTKLTTVNIPSATYINRDAFANCTSLENISLPQVTQIEEAAFLNCTSLTMMPMPKVETIGRMVFKGCSNLQTVSLPLVRSIGGEAFAGTSLTSLELTTAQDKRLDGIWHSQYGETATVFGDTRNTVLTIGSNYGTIYGGESNISVNAGAKTLTVSSDVYTFKEIIVIDNKPTPEKPDPEKPDPEKPKPGDGK